MDVPAGAGLRQQFRPQAARAGADGRCASGRAVKEAGLPDGVFNVVHCSNEDAEQLYTDPRIAAVSFVGSSGVAEYIYKTASAHGKRVQAFGAAKNHAIVMPDADLDATVNAIMGGAFGSAGERCMALPVVVAVGDETADKLIARLKPLVEALKVGPGCMRGQEENEMGPVVSDTHQKKVLGYIDKGESEGAKLVVDGRKLRVPGYDAGYYVGGTLFDHVTPEMTIWREEILARCWGLCARRTITAPLSWSTAMSLATAAPFSPATATPRVNSSTTCRRGWSGERAGTGADGVPQLWRLEALGVWRVERPRAGRRALLHAHEDRHRTLAGRAADRI